MISKLRINFANFRSELKTSKAAKIIFALFLFYTFQIIVTAWTCDDAFITYDTAANFLRGYGLRYNIDERVQSFTNPLMLFCMIIFGGITGEGYFSMLIINLVTSLTAFWLVAYKLSKRNENGELSYNAVLPLLVLIFSKSFIVFSTSGMENSLEHLLIAIFCVQLFKNELWTKKRLYLLCLTATLLVFCRYDMVFLVLPALIWIFFFKSRKDGVKLRSSVLFGFLGVLPFIVWEMFCLVYYGFLFPNTAYAKLNSGISKIEYIGRGVEYFFLNIKYDAVGVTSLVIVFSAVLIMLIKTKQNKVKHIYALVAGILIYLVYVTYIGGDFMAGRLYTPLILLSAVILGRFDLAKANRYVTAVGVVCVIGLGQYASYYVPPVLHHFNYTGGSVDEMKYYARSTNLILGTIKNNGYYKNYVFFTEGERFHNCDVMARRTIGMVKQALSETTHVVDKLALSEPLLARLPAIQKT